MSDTHDPEAESLHNGDISTEEGESNGLSGSEAVVDQEAESADMHNLESKEDMFVDAPDDMQENQFQEIDNGTHEDDTTSGVAKQYKEERDSFAREVANLRYQLKALADTELVAGDTRGQEEMVIAADDNLLLQMLNECSRLVNIASEERKQTENTIRELHGQIDNLNGRVRVEQDVEIVADRMLASLAMLVNQEELSDYSVMGKFTHAERSTSLLVDQYSWFLYETDQLRQCLLEGGFIMATQDDFGYGSIFAAARGELLELKRKEVEIMEKLNHIEVENKKLVEQVEKEKKALAETMNAELGRVKAELEQEKNRCANTKEKLSMAVTKGKALVQQRDSLRQSLSEKASELEKCLVELQEKSRALEAAELHNGELIKCESLVASLKETLSQKNAILESLEEIFSQTNIPEEFQSVDIIEKLKWLVNSVASLQETLLQQNTNFESFEEIFSQTNVPEELKSMDIIERLKWLVDSVASLQEVLSLRTGVLNNVEEIFSHISIPLELKSTDVVERLKWLVDERNTLSESLLEFHKLKDALSIIDIPETASSSDLQTRIGWLQESVKQAKGEIDWWQDEIARTREAAYIEINRLSALLLAELQEKEYIKTVLDELTCKYEETVEKAQQVSFEKDQMVRMLLKGSGIMADSGIMVDSLEGTYQTDSDMPLLIDRCFRKIKEQNSVFGSSPVAAEAFERIRGLLYVRDQELMLCEKLLEEDMLTRSEVTNLSNELRMASQELATLKEEKNSLQKDLERSEEKSALVREKLSLAVKKGKGLVQDRENMKLLLEEKNSKIEKLKLELQQKESTIIDCRDQIDRLSTDLDQIPRLEADLVSVKGQHDQVKQFLFESNNMLQRVIEAVDHIVLPVDSVFEEPVEKVNWLAGYMNECEQAKVQAEQELEKVKEETTMLASKLAEAQKAMKSLEDSLSFAESQISQLAYENRELEVGKKNAEQDLQKAIDEANAQTGKFTEAWEAQKSLEDALSLAENNISVLVKEREEAQLSRAATETELEKVQEEVTIQTSKLAEAYRTIKSLEDSLSQAEVNISLLTEQNSHVQVGRSNLENEIKKLKDEAESHAGKLADASTNIKSLEEALSKAMNDIVVLEDAKKIAEQEISMLNSRLKGCMDELAGSSDSLESRSMEFISHFSDLQMLIKNEDLLSMVRKHFEKEFENLKNMDLMLNDIRNHFFYKDLEALHSQLFMKEDIQMTKSFPRGLDSVNNEMDDDVNAPNFDNISLCFKKTVDGFQLRNKVVTDNFESFFIFIDEMIGALLRKITTTKDAVIGTFEHMESMKKEIKIMEMQKEDLEKTIATLQKDSWVLQSACTNATGELQFEVKNSLLELTSVPELAELNHVLTPEVSEASADDTEHQQFLDESKNVKMAENLLVASRKVHVLAKLLEKSCNVAASNIEDLQNKLKETTVASQKEREEKDQIQKKFSELENDVELLQNSCQELKVKMGDYQAIEERLKETEEERLTLRGQLLMREKEAEGLLMSASQLKMLFDKIRKVEISSVESEIDDMGPYHSSDMKKLFHIIDSVTKLHNQINVLSGEKKELQSTLSKQILEIENMKEEVEIHARYKQDLEEMKSELSELTLGLEKMVDILGGNEIIGVQKSGLLRLLPVLENRIMALHMEAENSKSQAQELHTKFLGSQKTVDELSTRVKLLEDSPKNRTAQPDVVKERSIFEATSLPSGSEISEIEDVGSVGKKAIAPVPSAAHVRTMRKGSTDHLALDVDLESSSLINDEETDEDKGHAFKSLNTTGLIPRQGKLVADRIDGIWVSGSRALMNRPRARLGLIAYWLVLHIWLLGTIL